jgi:hypothetical protein
MMEPLRPRRRLRAGARLTGRVAVCTHARA